MRLSSVHQAIEDIKKGRFVIIVDDEGRENEGDLAIAAKKITADAVNFMTIYARGLICLPVKGARLDDLEIPLMVRRNASAGRRLLQLQSMPHIISRPVFPPPPGTDNQDDCFTRSESGRPGPAGTHFPVARPGGRRS